MRSRADGMSLRTKIALLLVGLTVMTAAIIGTVGYLVLRERLLRSALHDGRIYVTEEIARLRLLLHGVREDVLFLASSNAMLDFLDAPDGIVRQVAEDRLERSFAVLARTEPRYRQIRYIDLAGDEQIRINVVRGSLDTVAEAELQNKSTEPYFVYVEGLAKGEVYVSPLNLNREHGVIETPHQPAIRFVTPVFDNKGRRRGGVVVNVAGAPFLTGGLQGSNHLLLLDSEGYFLRHRDQSVTFGFDLNQSNNALHLAPILAEQIAHQSRGAFLNERCTWTEGPCATTFERLQYDTRPDAYWTIAHQRELATVLAPLRAQTWGFVLAALGAATLAGLCGYVGALRITGPVNALARAAERIEAGESDIKVVARGTDEFAVMARAFNRMTTTLKALVERDQSMLRQEREVRIQLERAAAELSRSNHDLEQFVYIASHDLKAPLSAIVQLADWLEEDLGPSLEGDTVANLHLLRGRALRLSALLTDLSEYLRATKPAEMVESVDTNSLVKRVVEELRPPSSMIVEVAGTLPVVEAPAGVLERVFRELIENAIRHRDRDEGAVWIAAKDLGEAYQFEVEDDGPGIPARFHKRIFQVFQTLKPRDEVEGSGIGLAIVSRLLEICGGQIAVASTPEQRGTTFRFTWPKHLRHRQVA
jgi:signal transduction histidine kinase